MESKIITDGHTAAVIQVCGIFDTKTPRKAYDLLDFSKLNPVPTALRLDSVVFAIQEKMGIILWWKKDKGNTLLLPMESRGRLDWEAVQGLQSGDEGKGVAMTAFGVTDVKHFVFVADFTKLYRSA